MTRVVILPPITSNETIVGEENSSRRHNQSLGAQSASLYKGTGGWLLFFASAGQADFRVVIPREVAAAHRPRPAPFPRFGASLLAPDFRYAGIGRDRQRRVVDCRNRVRRQAPKTTHLSPPGRHSSRSACRTGRQGKPEHILIDGSGRSRYLHR